MSYLSPYIEALSKKRKDEAKSLIKREHSCGIFQDYGKNDVRPTEEKSAE